MKKISAPLLCLVILSSISGQNLQHESVAINIEVPVRVYDGDHFVSDLTLEDFLVYEDGKPQKLEAVYLIRDQSVQRRDERKRFAPKTQRNFYLFFEIAEYTPRINEAIELLANEILAPGDNLFVITPQKSYRMKADTLSKVSPQIFISQFRALLRRDAWSGSSEYREALNDLTVLVRTLSGGNTADISESSGIGFGGTTEELLQTYISLRARLEQMRKVDQQKLLEFAAYLKNVEGQKYVFLFYQREFLPEVKPEVFDLLMTGSQENPSIQLDTMALFGLNKREIAIDVERVKQAYADSSITIHFLFFSQPARQVSGIHMVEHSEDIFSAFREMAQATGGFTGSSANPGYLFRLAGEASSNYYLLYYTPQNYRSDGKFKNIEVKIKGKNFRVNHRAGYFAN